MELPTALARLGRLDVALPVLESVISDPKCRLATAFARS